MLFVAGGALAEGPLVGTGPAVPPTLSRAACEYGPRGAPLPPSLTCAREQGAPGARTHVQRTHEGALSQDPTHCEQHSHSQSACRNRIKLPISHHRKTIESNCPSGVGIISSEILISRPANLRCMWPRGIVISPCVK